MASTLPRVGDNGVLEVLACRLVLAFVDCFLSLQQSKIGSAVRIPLTSPRFDVVEVCRCVDLWGSGWKRFTSFCESKGLFRQKVSYDKAT